MSNRKSLLKAATVLLLVTGVTACASNKPSQRGERGERPQQAAFHFVKPTTLMLAGFDEDLDKTITSEELARGIDREWLAAAGDPEAALGPILFDKWAENTLGTGETRFVHMAVDANVNGTCLLYTSPSPRDLSTSRMPSSA